MAVCKRCLLHELSQESFRSIYAYIEQLPQEVKTPDEEYRKRLVFCRSCDSMVNGMCRHCGCFVEVRAAKRLNQCPGIPKKW